MVGSSRLRMRAPTITAKHLREEQFKESNYDDSSLCFHLGTARLEQSGMLYCRCSVQREARATREVQVRYMARSPAVGLADRNVYLVTFILGKYPGETPQY